MATINDLRVSITGMARENALAIIMGIRKNRMAPPKKTTRITARTKTASSGKSKNPLKNISKEQLLKLLKESM